MKIAVGVAGVSSVNIDEAKNQLVVIGVGVDSFELIKCLKKKFKCASIVSIEEVKPPPPAQQKDGGKKEDLVRRLIHACSTTRFANPFMTHIHKAAAPFNEVLKME
nr:heavy metal-associated isoprenylated plant protein 47-like [Ipomoea batatas]